MSQWFINIWQIWKNLDDFIPIISLICRSGKSVNQAFTQDSYNVMDQGQMTTGQSSLTCRSSLFAAMGLSCEVSVDISHYLGKIFD